MIVDTLSIHNSVHDFRCYNKLTTQKPKDKAVLEREFVKLEIPEAPYTGDTDKSRLWKTVEAGLLVEDLPIKGTSFPV